MSAREADETDVDEVPESASSTRKGRRPGIQVYERNPFVREAANNTNIGSKRIKGKDDNRFMIMSQDGEVIAPAGFHEIVEVDKSRFVKLYAQGFKAFAGLSPAGTKVFEVLMNIVMEHPGADRLWIHYKDVNESTVKMSQATFKRGMRELLEANFIAESDRQGMYWLNISFVFNGNRLAFIKEYRISPEKEAVTAARKNKIQLVNNAED